MFKTTFFFPDSLVNNILVAGGGYNIKSAYILQITFEQNNETVRQISFINVKDADFIFNDPFYANCDGRLVIGGGLRNKNVVEHRSNEFNSLPPTLVVRISAAASYSPNTNTLFVSGGYDSSGNVLDTIEKLMIKIDSNETKFISCHNTLPIHVYGHTTTILDNHIFLIGGFVGRNKTTRVWKGVVSKVTQEITFKEIQPMKYKRGYHFSIPFQDKIFVFGGEKNKKSNSKIEVYNGELWREVNNLAFYLSRSSGNAVLNRNGMIIIMTDNNGFVVFNPSSSSIQHFKDLKMKDDRTWYAALLI